MTITPSPTLSDIDIPLFDKKTGGWVLAGVIALHAVVGVGLAHMTVLKIAPPKVKPPLEITFTKISPPLPEMTEPVVKSEPKPEPTLNINTKPSTSQKKLVLPDTTPSIVTPTKTVTPMTTTATPTKTVTPTTTTATPAKTVTPTTTTVTPTKTVAPTTTTVTPTKTVAPTTTTATPTKTVTPTTTTATPAKAVTPTTTTATPGTPVPATSNDPVTFSDGQASWRKRPPFACNMSNETGKKFTITYIVNTQGGIISKSFGSSGDVKLDNKLKQLANSAEFNPHIKNGQPVKAKVTVVVTCS